MQSVEVFPSDGADAVPAGIVVLALDCLHRVDALPGIQLHSLSKYIDTDAATAVKSSSFLCSLRGKIKYIPLNWYSDFVYFHKYSYRTSV